MLETAILIIIGRSNDLTLGILIYEPVDNGRECLRRDEVVGIREYEINSSRHF